MITMRNFYNSGKTRDYNFRIESLQKLKKEIELNSSEIAQALRKDLGKSPEESYLTEISIILEEIRFQVKNLKRWARPKKVRSGIALLPSGSKIIYEPYGIVLVIAPWNYPFQLLLDPLVGALSAGNCAVLKSSRRAPETSKIVSKIITAVFDKDYVRVFEGNDEELDTLLDYRFDYIFFTGSPVFGRRIMEKASRHLTPVTLELGGKSPCIVSSKFNMELAAKRVAWGKFMNAGQTCVAPDYVFIEKGQKDVFIDGLKKALNEFYGDDIKSSPHYGRIISMGAHDRLTEMMSELDGSIVFGGDSDKSQKYISPTIIENPSEGTRVMQEEIFGPLLPVKEYDSINEVIEYVNARNKPLALYYFGEPAEAEFVLKNTSSGGACINDTILHVANKRLPFGGVGESGIGKYHGKSSFYLFSNQRGVIVSSKFIDFLIKYPPYKYFGVVKKMI
jgi:aldehyde dehydrogenase (NAD+)